jgi:threonine/homoserine/homoserine lactone efflux protein
MADLHTIALFMVAALALNFAPGPDMLYVIARSTGEGRRAGIASALGIAVGCLVHTGALALGLSALLAAVPLAYQLIRYAGAAYLVYLGIGALTHAMPLDRVVALEPTPLGAIFRQGVVTNVLNPKVALFFLAFLPQFIDPSRGNPAFQIMVLGLLFNTSGTLVNLGVAALSSGATGWLRRRERSARALQRVTGTIFIALGVRLAVAGRG